MTLGGPVDTVASDDAEIAKVGGNMGLILNSSKCELLAHRGVTVYAVSYTHLTLPTTPYV